MIDPKAVERFMMAPWFVEVEPEIKKAICNVLVETRGAPGTTLLAQGQPNDHLTFLIEGTAMIERGFRNGHRELIIPLNAPAVFGTTSFFLPTPPTVTVLATSEVWILTLYHPAHESLRRTNPQAAEAIALAVVRALSERFDLIDELFTQRISQHSSEPVRLSEWAGFRTRLFEEHGM
jgi:CRP/FNR family transcriptional regulator, cyclic AMP receptor protein